MFITLETVNDFVVDALKSEDLFICEKKSMIIFIEDCLFFSQSLLMGNCILRNYIIDSHDPYP